MGEDGGQNVEAYYYGACLTQAVHSIFKALEIEKYRLSGCPFVISFTGGGGKTSLIRRMAWEGRELGLKVLVIPTTHMALPEQFFCAGTFGGGFGADIKRQWDCGCGKSGGTKARREKDILLGLGILPAGQRKSGSRLSGGRWSKEASGEGAGTGRAGDTGRYRSDPLRVRS